MQQARVLGIKVNPVRMDEAVSVIGGFVREGGPHLVITLGTEMVMAAQQDLAFQQVVESASLVVPDAVGVVWAARRNGMVVEDKIAGVELLAELMQQGVSSGWRFFFLGGAPGVAQEAAAALAHRHPGCQVVGTHHGFFESDEGVIDQIKGSGANILFLALGYPRQELWYWKHRDRLGVAVGVGVGGSFDVYAGRTRRAPRWMIRLGLEWTWRLILQPARWRRMLALPAFAMAVMREPRQRP